MSHLAYADEVRIIRPMPRSSPCSADGRDLAVPPNEPGSLIQPGIFLGPEYYFDLVRPGAALYGVAPQAGRPNPMRPVVRLRAKWCKSGMCRRTRRLATATRPKLLRPRGLRPWLSVTRTGSCAASPVAARAWFNGSFCPSSGACRWTASLLMPSAFLQVPCRRKP